MINRKPINFFVPLIVVVLLFALLWFLALVGKTSRKILVGHSVYTVENQSDALFVWRSLGVRGRTGLFLDRHLNLADIFRQSSDPKRPRGELAVPTVNNDNFLSMALYMNVFRKIVHIIPDDSWPEVQQKLSTLPFVAYNGRQFRFTVDGVPVIVTRLEDIPVSSEKVLVYLNAKYQRSYNATLLIRLMEDPDKADVVVVRRGND